MLALFYHEMGTTRDIVRFLDTLKALWHSRSTMQKRLALLGVYLCLLPCIILALAAYLLILVHNSSPKTTESLSKDSFQSIPNEPLASSYIPQATEVRVQVLTDFFARYNSPLSNYAKKIVETADKYTLDWRLIPAIAMQESTLCKKIPKNSHNCWGFGIYGGKVTKFDNYNQAIETVTKTLATEYKQKRGLEHPGEIVTRYTPGSSTWADGVTLVMNRIQSSL